VVLLVPTQEQCHIFADYLKFLARFWPELQPDRRYREKQISPSSNVPLQWSY
jgi:hypothetical protein